jgi:hypothetical protein
VQVLRSLWTNVPGFVLWVAGIGLSLAMCLRSCVMRWDASGGCVEGVSSSPGILWGSPYTSSATEACRSVLQAVRIPRRTSESASVQCWSA